MKNLKIYFKYPRIQYSKYEDFFDTGRATDFEIDMRTHFYIRKSEKDLYVNLMLLGFGVGVTYDFENA